MQKICIICKKYAQYAKNIQKYAGGLTNTMRFEVSFQSLAVQLKPKTH